MQCDWDDTERRCMQMPYHLLWCSVWPDQLSVSSRNLSVGQYHSLWWQRCNHCRWSPAYSHRLCLPYSSRPQRHRWRHRVFCKETTQCKLYRGEGLSFNFFLWGHLFITHTHSSCHNTLQHEICLVLWWMAVSPSNWTTAFFSSTTVFFLFAFYVITLNWYKQILLFVFHQLIWAEPIQYKWRTEIGQKNNHLLCACSSAVQGKNGRISMSRL